MPLTNYRFRTAVSSFFEMPTGLATRLLPSHLKPLEVHHGSAIFAVTAFDFTESMVGAYQEIVLAVIVPPLVQPEGQFPKSAFYPFLLGTSTKASREHAIERWHLPHYMADVAVDFTEREGGVDVRVREEEEPILDLSVADHKWEKADDLYQAFMANRAASYKVDIHMRGTFSEHEEEAGQLLLHEHAMTERLEIAEIEVVPFRELWMKDGMQTFEELETLAVV